MSITSELARACARASFLELIEDNGDGTSTWHDTGSGEFFRLDHRHVLQFGLTDKMREGLERLAQEDVSEPQEGISEVTEEPSEALARTPGVEVVGGHGEGWQWQKVRTGAQVCPNDTDGDGDCHLCTEGRGQGRSECKDGWIGGTVMWAIDNMPAVKAWKAGDQIEPAPEFMRVILPHEIVVAIARL